MQTHTHTQTPTGCKEILEVMASFICLIVGMVLSIYVCLLSCFSRVWLFATPWLSLWGSSVRGDSPDKNTGMGCYALLQGIFQIQGLNPHWLLCLLHWQVGSLPLVLYLYLTLCNSMDCSPPGSSIHRVFQASILEWVSIFPFKRSSWPSNWTSISCVSCIAGGFFTL